MKKSIITRSLTGTGIFALETFLGTIFDKAKIEEAGFKNAVDAIKAVGGYNINTEGFNVVDFNMSSKNFFDFWEPTKGYINKIDFSSALGVYNCLPKTVAAEAAAAVLIGLGKHLSKKGKKWSSVLYAAGGGAGGYAAVTSNEYLNALLKMPYQIEGENLVDYTVNHPQFAESMKGLYDNLRIGLEVSGIAGIGLAATGGAFFVYNEIKNFKGKLPAEIIKENYDSERLRM